MLTLPPSVKIYVAATPVDARKSFDGLAAIVESQFGLGPMTGHMFVFLNRRGHAAQTLFWDRNGFCIVKKRLEAGTFCLSRTGACAYVGRNRLSRQYPPQKVPPLTRVSLLSLFC